MALLHTPQKDDEFYIPDFKLKNIDDSELSLDDIKGDNGTVVAFICNHCPYVKAIIERLVTTFDELQNHGIGSAAIMPNDTSAYPADSFDNMKLFAKEHNFNVPYLIDETQEVAKAFDAICTPDIFGFNAQGSLQYRGRLDSAGPNPPDLGTRHELKEAMLRIAEIGAGPHEQFSSMGCSIKWKS